MSRAAVVVNPTKPDDDEAFRESVRRIMAEMARNVGLPTGLDEALAVALGGAQQPIDTGRINGTLFVVMAGLGLGAQMLSDTSEPLKRELGWFAYAISAIRHLAISTASPNMESRVREIPRSPTRSSS